MTIMPDSPKAFAAFEDLRPLLDQTARLVAQCPFEDSGDRKQLAMLVAAYFCGSALQVMDSFSPRSPNVDRLVTMIKRELASHEAEKRGVKPSPDKNVL